MHRKVGSHLMFPRGFWDRWGSGWACQGSSRMSWGRRSLWEEAEALCGLLPTPHPEGQLPHTKAAL